MAASIEMTAAERFTTFGDLLKYLRRRTGLTQRELSIAVGYSESQISRLEKNERMPDVSTIAARFLPVLQLGDKPELAERLLELAASARREDAPVAGLAPYKGLRFFDECDADSFFGRETMVAELVEYLMAGLQSGSRFLAVIGASGSGKSSLVRAGVIPELRWREPSSNWLISVITPTAQPLASLTAGLASDSFPGVNVQASAFDPRGNPLSLHQAAAKVCDTAGASRFLMVVDQFEELFTLCRSTVEQQAFVGNLLAAAYQPGGPAIVVIVLRADFYAHCASIERLRRCLAERQVYLGPMTCAELRRAIEEPARAAHWEIEPGLTELLLADVGSDQGQAPEPGALPLLSHALLETWHRRRGRMMTLGGYSASGGVRGAIMETAESVYYDRLVMPEREIARQIFLRLTELGGDAAMADTRRRVSFEELAFGAGDTASIQEVLKILADARLVTLSRDSAEVAHEALIRAWPTLRNWLEEDREGLRLHRQLTEAAQEWEEAAQDPSGLYRGTKLARARDWVAAHPNDLNDLERRFLAACVLEAEREAAEIEAQRLRELDAARRQAEKERQYAQTLSAAFGKLKRQTRFLVAALILVGALAAAATVFGRETARLKQISDSRFLASAAVSSLSIDPERSVLLALEALHIADTLEARNALHQALPELHLLRVLPAHRGGAVDVAFSPDGSWIASIGEDRTVKLWDAITGERIDTFYPQNDQYSSGVAISADSRLLAAGWETELIIWDIASREKLHIFRGESVGTTVGYNLNAGQVRFSPDGQHVAAANMDGLARVWDVGSGAEIMALVPEGLPAKSLDFSADGRFIATGGDEGLVTIWDARSGEKLAVFELGGIIHSLSFAPDGHRLAAGSEDGSAKIWDAGTGQELVKLPRQIGMYDIAFLADGRLATAGQDGATRIYDASSGQMVLTLAGHASTVIGVAGSPDGRLMATSGYDGTLRIWDTAPGRELLTLAGHQAIIWDVAYSPDGRWIGSAGVDGSLRLWEAGSGALVKVLEQDDAAWTSIAFSPGGEHLASGAVDGRVLVWEIATGRVIWDLSGHNNIVVALVFSPDGGLLASASWDGTARVWELEGGQVQAVLEGLQDSAGLMGVAFSPDGREVFISGGYPVSRWDVFAGRLLQMYPETGKEIYGLAVSPDGRLLALGDQDGAIQIRDAASGDLLNSISGHAGLVLRLRFSTDGSMLASAAFDRMARVWNVATGEEMFGLYGNTSNVFSVGFTPDSRNLVTAGADGMVRTYLADTEELMALAAARLTRNLTPEECLKYLRTKCP